MFDRLDLVDLLLLAPLALILVATGAIVLPALGALRRAREAGATLGGKPLEWMHVLALRLTGSNPRTALDAVVTLRGAGHDVDLGLVEAHRMAGGDVARVAEAAAVARERGGSPTFVELCALELTGRDPVEAAQTGDYRPASVAEMEGRLRAMGKSVPGPRAA